MIAKLIALSTSLIAASSIWAGYTQRSALHLRQEKQAAYWPRHRTYMSGRYYGETWEPLPSRSSYGEFRGGGPSAGK